jgi:hypothetical protein
MSRALFIYAAPIMVHLLIEICCLLVNALSLWNDEHSIQNRLDHNQGHVQDPPKENQKMSQKKKIQRMNQRIDHRTNNRGMFLSVMFTLLLIQKQWIAAKREIFLSDGSGP